MKKIATAIILSCVTFGASAEDFFSTRECDTLFDLGVQIGINTSNRTIGKNALSGYHHEGWGTGFDLGITADLNIRDYLSIQPGIFFESRSNSYTMISNYSMMPDNFLTTLSQAGSLRSYYFTIPVMGRVHFNITDDLRWNVEAGPYIALCLSSKLKNKVCQYSPEPALGPVLDEAYGNNIFNQKAKGCDFGIKMGTGLTLFRHYSFAIHYLAGCTHAWKDLKSANYTYSFGGRSKEWTFTLSYTF